MGEIEDEMSERKQGWINNHNNPKRTTEKNREGRREEEGSNEERELNCTKRK